MKIISSSKKPTIAIVCCQHGDEIFGLEVFKYFKLHLSSYPAVKLILANEEAVARKTRYIDEDLNRVFNMNKEETHERVLARQILPEITEATYVLDIHTTTSDLRMTPIITDLNQETKNILRLCPFPEIAYMQPPLGNHALIGQVKAGVSLEFNEKYAKTPEALEIVIKIVDGLQKKSFPRSQKRKVYFIDRAIPLEVKIKKEYKNFEYISKENFFPFLLREKSYTTIRGFAAKVAKEMEV